MCPSIQFLRWHLSFFEWRKNWYRSATEIFALDKYSTCWSVRPFCCFTSSDSLVNVENCWLIQISRLVFLWRICLSENCMQMAGDFVLSRWHDVFCFSGSGVFLERWTLRDVTKQRADVGKGERLFLGGKWGATGTILMHCTWSLKKLQ